MSDKLANVIVNPDYIRHDRIFHATVPDGFTISQIVGANPFEGVQVILNDDIIPREKWGLIHVKDKDLISIAVFPGSGGGGKDILRTVAIIAIAVVASVYVGPWAADAMGFVTGTTAFGISSGVAAGVTTMSGALLVNALIPPQIPSQPKQIDYPGTSYAITSGTNSFRQYGAVSKIYGYVRYAPDFAANNYTEIKGNDHYLNMLMILGYAPINITDIEIGDTPIEDYDGVAYEIGNIDEITLYKGDVEEISLAVQLYPEESYVDGVQVTQDTEWVDYDREIEREIEDGVTDHTISIDFSFPVGLRSLNDVGTEGTAAVDIEVQTKHASITIENELATLFGVGTRTAFVLDITEGFATADCGDNFIKKSGAYFQIFKNGAWVNIAEDTELYSQVAAMWSAYESHTLTSSYVIFFICDFNLATPYNAGTEFSEVAASEEYALADFLMDYLSALGTWGTAPLYVGPDETPHGTYPVFTIELADLWKHGCVWFSPQTRAVKYLNTTSEAWGNLTSYVYRNSSTEYGTIVYKQFVDTHTDPLRKNITFDYTSTDTYAQIKIIHTRTDTEYDAYIFADCYVSAMRSISDSDPVIDPDYLFKFLAVQIKATNQLSGSIDNITVMGKSVLPTWDGTDWDTEIETDNPAWIYADILRGAQMANPVPDSMINGDELLAWATACTNSETSYNNFHDGELLMLDYLNMVATTGRAQWAIVDNEFSVILDTEQTLPKQMISPRNSWGFSSSKAFVTTPHALKVKYIDPDVWEQDIVMVYSDGYTESTATEFETLDTIGVTDPDQAWKYGRYYLAAAILRPEVYTVNMDFENLVARRGDLVTLANDVMLVGLGSARITAVTDIRTLVVDEDFAFETGKSYVLRIRKNDNTQISLPIDSAEGIFNIISVTSDATGVSVGDLCIYGESENECLDAKIKSIEYYADFSAKLTLVDAAPDIHDADTGTIPAYNPHITTPVDYTAFAPTPPVVESITTSAYLLDNVIHKKIQICFALASNRVPVQKVNVKTRAVNRAWVDYAVDASSGALEIDGGSYDDDDRIFAQVQAVSSYGIAGNWSAIKSETITFPEFVWAADAVLSVKEKKEWRSNWAVIDDEYDVLAARMTVLSLDIADITTKVVALCNYLIAAGVWSDPYNAYLITGTDLTDLATAYYTQYTLSAKLVDETWSALGADVTGDNTANDTTYVGGTLATQIRDSATTAHTAVTDIISDSIFSAAEKAKWRNSWDAIYDNFEVLRARMIVLSISTAALDTATQALCDYLIAAGVWSAPSTAYTITGTAFLDLINAYYYQLTRAEKLTAEAWAAFGADVTGDNTANDTTYVGGVASGTVRDNAAAAMAVINGMASDSILSVAEKATWRREWVALYDDFEIVRAKMISLSISTGDIDTTVIALGNYLIAAGVWSAASTAYTITGTELDDVVSAYYIDLAEGRQAIAQAYSGATIPAGTSMLFNQAAAPTGWTKKSDWANVSSLIVGNTYSSGGSASPITYTTAVTVSDHTAHTHTITVDGHTLTIAEMPNHGHPFKESVLSAAGSAAYTPDPSGTSDTNFIGTVGGGGSHNHTGSAASGGPTSHTVGQSTYNPRYLTVIAATKN